MKMWTEALRRRKRKRQTERKKERKKKGVFERERRSNEKSLHQGFHRTALSVWHGLLHAACCEEECKAGSLLRTICNPRSMVCVLLTTAVLFCVCVCVCVFLKINFTVHFVVFIGGGGFSPLARTLGECSNIHSPPAFFFFWSGD